MYFGASQDDTIIINDGTFIGGNGGVVTNSTDGLLMLTGNGVFIDYADVIINGGTFTGGAAGMTIGVFDKVGAGVHVQDSNLTINDGIFRCIGLRVENRYYDSVNTISNGTFETIEYISNYDDYTPTTLLSMVRIEQPELIFTAVQFLILSYQDQHIMRLTLMVEPLIN